MPPPTVMKLRGQKIEKAISSSPAERDKKRELKKKDNAEKPISKWVVYVLLFALVGSAFVNIFVSIQTSPSMSEAH